ncbi:TetR/AcrR family transcriptional regulator [Pseudophaeobacter arcticus]|jgi:AcrR family transcriptional regulator|uniref:TetR/AcrR family transcriptional regulator n=1 Tax=Pseudophaeobacter arcticus TaxID=385492 RepID=UPI0003FF11BC|nr:TetR/AcrR family transcriptional regulator [Pseudophaeobacter arcticus]
MTEKVKENQRQRAPSKRSLATRDRIFDAAEQLFAERGFEGASIRDIARAADVQGALVNHHGGSKETLFATVVTRRAQELAQLRQDALAQAKTEGPLTLRRVLTCFIAPFIEKTLNGGAAWSAYGRLIAHVSSDQRWQHIAQSCFDPTARVFLAEIAAILPQTSQQKISTHFVFMVSAMLSLCTSRWRIAGLAEAETTKDPGGDLAKGPAANLAGNLAGDLTEQLLAFCEAGFKS